MIYFQRGGGGTGRAGRVVVVVVVVENESPLSRTFSIAFFT